jgi:hypothetical protein
MGLETAGVAGARPWHACAALRRAIHGNGGIPPLLRGLESQRRRPACSPGIREDSRRVEGLTFEPRWQRATDASVGDQAACEAPVSFLPAVRLPRPIWSAPARAGCLRLAGRLARRRVTDHPMLTIPLPDVVPPLLRRCVTTFRGCESFAATSLADSRAGFRGRGGRGERDARDRGVPAPAGVHSPAALGARRARASGTPAR